MSDLVERVREVLPSVRRDLEDLVRIESVWADPARRDEVHRSAKAVADLLSQAGFGDVRIVSEDGAPAVFVAPGAPRRAHRVAVLPTTTFSPKATAASGSRRHSSRPNVTGGSTAAAAPMTRPVSQRIWRRSGRTAANHRWA